MTAVKRFRRSRLYSRRHHGTKHKGEPLEPYEWIELFGLGVIMVMLWDIHGYLRDILKQLNGLERKP